jgi:D-alanyl-D-alanine carboxypeptidase-like protein
VKVIAYLASAAVAATVGFHASAHPLSAGVRHDVVAAHEWNARCPVPLSHLRVLTVRYHGFDGRPHNGKLIVNEDAVRPLTSVFRRLYALHFPIRHMELTDTYGPRSRRPADGDFTASFECRQASASPCTSVANRGNGSWSQHAYGEAVDLNPVENPYVGCGMTRDKASLSYLHRDRLRRGMVTPAVVAAFASVGWGWGGSWSGTTKDYMHFSATGH